MKKLFVSAGCLLFGACLMVMVLLGASFLLLVGGGGSTAEAKPPGQVPGLSPILLQAYQMAVERVPALAPDCEGLRWQILAGIAEIESNNAAGRSISEKGDVTPPIIGPSLNGSGAGGNTTAIRDTDQGVWDHDTRFDAAVGVLQFIPSSWRQYGQDGNGDKLRDPHNVFDNALGSAMHLCGNGAKDLADPATLRQALYGYNHSWSYVDKVTAAIEAFEVTSVAPDLPQGSGTGAAIVAAAMKWIGTPYSWGGGGPSGPSRGICCTRVQRADGSKIVGFDCSGLTQYAAAQVGIKLPRQSQYQSRVGNFIPSSDGLAALRPGDLVFFGHVPSLWTSIYHVGIYVGGGKMVNAPKPGYGVRVDLVWLDQYAGAVRLA